MDESRKLKIKIKPVQKKLKRERLPRKLTRDYPSKLPAAFITEEALHSLMKFAASDLGYELGGVLVGKVGKASHRMFVEIMDFIPATKGVSRRASFEFTNEAQQEIHNIKESGFKDLQIVGWFHTHPGYGIFLSSADQFIDQHYFNEKYHIAVVIDPCGAEIEVGSFVWDKDRKRVRVPLLISE